MAGMDAAVSASGLFRDVEQLVRQYVYLTDAQSCVVALWVAHTHTFEAADCTPYLSVTSSEKRSGKTRLLEVLELLVSSPWFTGRTSAAVLIRKIDKDHPTLLLDESDAAFNGEKEYAEALRGILNTGYRRGGKASMCVGQGANIGFKDFSTFCPKALAGIGKQPDTVTDRSIPIRLKRKLAGETVSRFRRRDVNLSAAGLRTCLDRWSDAVLPQLGDARPSLPDALSDRQQDVVEALLAIADLIGDEWPERVRAAVASIFGAELAQDESIGVRLLADIKGIFAERDTDRIASAELTDALSKIETAPWGEWSHGKPLSPAKLARLLRGYEISPQNIRIASGVPKGYYRADFEDAWLRYPLSPPCPQNATSLQANTGAAFSDFEAATDPNPVAAQNSEKLAPNGPCSAVALSIPQGEGRGNGKGLVEKPDTPAKRKQQREFFEGEVGL